ncbi:MAG: sulfatase-like hydrolase/transferase [Planctomycetota bacterium]
MDTSLRRLRVRLVRPLLVATLVACAADEAERPPNVVLLIADDLGYGDVGFTGGDLPTPEIDRLASDGIALDRFYCQPKCTPTRAGLLTGRHPIRFGMQHGVVTPWEEHGLPTTERTLAEAFGEAGYQHRALFGKWHLGHHEADHHPFAHGFTEFVGHMNGRIDYFAHTRLEGPGGEPSLDWMRGRELEARPGRYATELVAEEAIAFLRRRSADDQPFLLVVPFLAPHWPNQAPPDYVERFRHLPEPRRTFAAKVASLDSAIGRIRRELDDRGLGRDTLVMFLSDNGADATKGGSNVPLAGGKHTPLEGGVRCAAALRLPDRLPAGVRRASFATYLDVFPTLAHFAGLEAGEVDGHDRWDQWATGAHSQVPNELFVFMRGEGGEELIALENEEFKLVRMGAEPWSPGAPRGTVRLMRHVEDPLERLDCQAAYPKVTAQMLARLIELRALGTGPQDPALDVHSVPPAGWTAPPDWRPGAHRGDDGTR